MRNKKLNRIITVLLAAAVLFCASCIIADVPEQPNKQPGYTTDVPGEESEFEAGFLASTLLYYRVQLAYRLSQAAFDVNDVKIRFFYGSAVDDLTIFSHLIPEGNDIAGVRGAVTLVNESWDICAPFRTIENFTKENCGTEIEKDRIVYRTSEDITLPKELFQSRLGFVAVYLSLHMVLEDGSGEPSPWGSLHYLYYKLDGDTVKISAQPFRNTEDSVGVEYGFILPPGAGDPPEPNYGFSALSTAAAEYGSGDDLRVWFFHSSRGLHNIKDLPYAVKITVSVAGVNSSSSYDTHLVMEAENRYGKQYAPVLDEFLLHRLSQDRVFGAFEEIIVPKEWLTLKAGWIVFRVTTLFADDTFVGSSSCAFPYISYGSIIKLFASEESWWAEAALAEGYY